MKKSKRPMVSEIYSDLMVALGMCSLERDDVIRLIEDEKDILEEVWVADAEPEDRCLAAYWLGQWDARSTESLINLSDDPAELLLKWIRKDVMESEIVERGEHRV